MRSPLEFHNDPWQPEKPKSGSFKSLLCNFKESLEASLGIGECLCESQWNKRNINLTGKNQEMKNGLIWPTVRSRFFSITPSASYFRATTTTLSNSAPKYYSEIHVMSISTFSTKSIQWNRMIRLHFMFPSGNVKALYRRGIAHIKVWNPEEAERDLRVRTALLNSFG